MKPEINDNDAGSLEFHYQDVCNQKAVTYCEMVTHKEFEKQKLSSSQSALVELLEQILTDQRMSRKEKMDRLKLFKQSYPDIYAHRFPEDMANENVKEKSSRRRMGTLKLKFKNLRL
uniref:Uncharacterized protein n=1 Tax=Timema shepardi TaxID=629360 RepID=A0A7R9AT38_TIMSH|nr:unnamed protein product [Timema shepardi]